MLISSRNAKIVETSSVREAIKEAYPFTVDKFPLSGPDGMKTDIYGLFRYVDGKCEFVGNKSVKKRYVPHTVNHVADVCQAASHAMGGSVALKTDFHHGHIVTMTPEMSEMKRLNSIEQLTPIMMLKASYDGKSILMSMGLYNPLCKNQELFESVKECNVNIRHNSTIDFKMENLIKKLSVLRQSWGTLDAMIDHMNGKQTHIDDFIKELFPEKESKRGKTIAENRKTEIKERLRSEQGKTGEAIGEYATNWRLFNAIQGYFQHDVTRNKGTSEIETIMKSNKESNQAFQLLSV